MNPTTIELNKDRLHVPIKVEKRVSTTSMAQTDGLISQSNWVPTAGLEERERAYSEALREAELIKQQQLDADPLEQRLRALEAAVVNLQALVHANAGMH